MTTMKDLIERHLAERDLSVRSFADQMGMSYPTVLSLLNKGHVPRKPEHREAIRRALGVGQEQWAGVLAASGKDGAPLPSDGPLTLQQMLVKALYANGYSEQSFAKATGVPYATILGVTRKGAVPRTDTVFKIADALGLDRAQVERAVDESRSRRGGEGEPADAAESAGTAPIDDAPSLAQLVADVAVRGGISIAAFAREHRIPYISLMRLINTGIPPRRKAVLDVLAKALQVSDAAFSASLAKSRTQPEPAEVRSDEERAATPFQAALREVVKTRKLSLKSFAEQSGLSVLTATRLVKHGALPSRSATHEKLRTLLGLDDEAYRRLLARSTGGTETEEAPPPEEFQHRETEEIRTESGGALSPRLPPVPARITDELTDLIGRLNTRQQSALHAFLLSLL